MRVREWYGVEPQESVQEILSIVYANFDIELFTYVVHWPQYITWVSTLLTADDEGDTFETDIDKTCKGANVCLIFKKIENHF